METQSKDDFMGKNSMAVMSVGVLVVFIGLVFFLYKWVSNKKGNVVFPAGINYTGNENQAEDQPLAPKKPVYDYAKYLTESNWTSYNSPLKQYSFQHPVEMNPLVFPGATSDMVTFDVAADVPARDSIMALVENISERDPKLVGKPEEFVKGYWKFFGGLKGLSSIEPYTNKAGLEGFKALYVNKGGATTGDNYFFIVPNDTNKMIHFSNVFPKTDDANLVFMRILESVSLKITVPPTPGK